MDSQRQLSSQIQQKNITGKLHRLSRVLGSLSEHRWATDGYPEVRNGHVQLLSNVEPEGTRNTVLAQRARITKQTMGLLVKDLAQSGYVFITPDQTDSRAQQVHLTDRGKDFLVYLSEALTDLERAFANVIGEARLHEFTETLEQLLVFTESRRQDLGL